MIAFASNSLLTRGALGQDAIDAASFTLIRLGTGAAALALLLRARPAPAAERGSWTSALALAGYAVAFTFAYTRIGAGIGALLLFAAVQITMISVGLARGERPLGRDWLGLAIAMTGVAWLTMPGATAPDLPGAALMLAAGACWGGYSLAGRRSRDPLAATTGNFSRAALLAAPALLWAVDPAGLTTMGVVLASVSGALASGLGYTIWYSALPALGAWRAAIVQLTVPILTGLAAALLLSEALTPRLLVASVLVTGGVWLSVRTGRPAR